MSDWFTIDWRDGAVVMLDQRRLPLEEVYLTCRDVAAVADGIRDMVVRGAPAIGVAAAMGMALALSTAPPGADPDEVLDRAAALLGATRPTAVNLFWALERMRRHWRVARDARDPAAAMVAEARAVLAEDIAICRRLGDHGAALIPDGATVLTHCNAGGLATGGWGTALGVIRSAVAQGKRVRVLADETRPFLQGARLTSWELHRDGIEVTVIADNAAGHFLSRGEVECVVVGSDRTVANGDVCNKIGTYGLGVLCAANGVPFYAAVPLSTIDLSMADGAAIPIEERSGAEVTHFAGTRTVLEGIAVRNPAFDVTPARYVSAIVTEAGVARPPYSKALAELFPPPGSA